MRTRMRVAVRALAIPLAMVALVGTAGAATPSRHHKPPANTSPPTISGTTQQGQTLTAVPGTWTGTPPIGYAYMWSDGTTGPTDTLAATDVGQTITVTVTASNAYGSSSATSYPTGPVAGASRPVPPSNTTAPAVSGTAQQGDTLTVSNGSWSGDTPMSFAYQWQDNGKNIAGATGPSYTPIASDVGHMVDAAVTATNDAGSAAATSQAVGPVTAQASSPQPVGDPLGRTWTSVMSDEFNGTAIDTSKWVALNGWGNNNVTSNAKNCIESGGNLILALPGDGTGCDLYSSKNYGAGANAHDLLVGDYLEARMWFPGPGSSPTATIDNWPAFWTYDGSNNWLAGENDIAEALGNMQYNYHSAKSSQNVNPPGLWGNSWHVYGIYRAATQVQIFYDGTLVGTVPTTDNGGPEAIMFTSGRSNSCCGAPSVTGPAGNVLVDWVREWQ